MIEFKLNDISHFVENPLDLPQELVLYVDFAQTVIHHSS